MKDFLRFIPSLSNDGDDKFDFQIVCTTYHGIWMTPPGNTMMWMMVMHERFTMTLLSFTSRKVSQDENENWTERLSFLISLPRHRSSKSKQTNYRKQAEIWEIQLFSSSTRAIFNSLTLSHLIHVSRDKQNLFICCFVLMFSCSTGGRFKSGVNCWGHPETSGENVMKLRKICFAQQTFDLQEKIFLSWNETKM